MNLEHLHFRTLWRLFSLCGLVFLVVCCVSGPILLHIRVFEPEGSCGTYNDAATGVSVFNPIRSRSQEHVADAFLGAASKATCLPGLNEDLCKFVVTNRVPAAGWRLVSRWDSPEVTTLFYRLSGGPPDAAAAHGGCAVVRVELRRANTVWSVFSYGVSYGPYNTNTRARRK